MRDDINRLGLPRLAQAYARRKGMAAIKRQPFEFMRVNALLMNPGKPNKFKNYDDGEKVRHAFKEAAVQVVRRLIDGD